MSNNRQNWDAEITDEYDDTNDNSSAETDLLKQLRRLEKEQSKKIKELENQLNGYKTAERESTVQQVLESMGVNPKIAKFMPQDIEVKPEVVETWVKENADIFGIQLQQQQPANQENLATLRQIDTITAAGQTPIGVDDMMLRIDQAQTADEVINMIFGAEQ
jgi:Trk K+ transport system NAD-binding subunit